MDYKIGIVCVHQGLVYLVIKPYCIETELDSSVKKTL